MNTCNKNGVNINGRKIKLRDETIWKIRQLSPKIIALLVCLLFFAVITATSTVQAAPVVINEVESNPPEDDRRSTTMEWVELYNPTSNDINLGGWTLSSTQYREGKTFELSGTIKANGYYVFEHSLWLLNTNPGESVILRDADKNPIDDTPVIKDDENDNYSWQRYPNGIDTASYSDWKFRLSTKGDPNSPVPDFIIQDISWSPSNPKLGDTVTITVKTKNQGSENAGGFYVCYYVDGSYYDRDYVSSLSAGSTTTTSFTWTAECGNHAIKAVADCYDAVTESDEENNWRSKGGLNIPCKPDLIVQDISWSPSSPKMGEMVTINVKTKNQGSGSAGTSTVKYYIDGSYVASDSVPSLSAGSISTQSFTWTANKCGDVQVKAVADATNAVTESDEGNNERTETVGIKCPKKRVHNLNTDKNFSTIQAAIDDYDTLRGHTITVDPGTYTENVGVTKSVTIRSSSGNPTDTIVQATNLSDPAFNILANNVTIDGFTIKGASYESGVTLDNSKYCKVSNNILSGNWDGVGLGYSSNNVIENNICENNSACGIYLFLSSDSTIKNNTCKDNDYGIYPRWSDNNAMINNNILNNNYGIYLYYSNNNIFNLNNLVNNDDNVYSKNSTNIWNSTEKITYTYKGKTYKKYLGNYWDDYQENDTDEDGIGDKPYNIDSDSDDYPLVVPSENYLLKPQTLKIAAFNIQIFGKTKREKKDVMDVLIKICQEFDIMLVQELKYADENTAPYYLEKINEAVGYSKYDFKRSERLGRSSSKEAYAYFYNTEKVKLINGSDYVYNDTDNVFEREPYIASFRGGNFDFTLVGIHTKPDDADSEIGHLADVVDSILADNPKEKDIIVMGDFNADGRYFNEDDSTNPFKASKYLWVITNDMDTMTKTNNTYDRMVTMNATFNHEYINSSAAVFYFDTEYGISDEELVWDVSDHYPIYANFRTDLTDDD